MSSVRHLIESLEGDYLEILGDFAPVAERALDALSARSASRGLWAREGSLFSSDPAVIQDAEDRLGWLDLPHSMRAELPRLRDLALTLSARRIERAILLGMGGSSLAPEVLREVFGVAPGGIDLVVLDATDPAQIRRVDASSDLRRTVFLASSKSGTTAETRTLLEYFAARLQSLVGERWTEHFVVISDPGTPLSALGQDKGFLASFAAAPDVGGRYSALTLFGLVPAALLGVDCTRLLSNAESMSHRCRAEVPETENTACRFGAALATLAQSGRDKLTLITSPALASFGWWAEQLIAESTGKSGTGILPVEGEPTLSADTYSSDRAFVYVRLKSDDNRAVDDLVDSISSLGHPIIVTQLSDRYDVGGQFFRWEMATAIAGLVLGINPFDQPNVEEAKDGARDALARYEQTGTLDEAEPLLVEGDLAIYGEPTGETMAHEYVGSFLRQARPGDYVALMAYVDRTVEHAALLQELRALLTDRLGIATTMGFGPRFLHSTGQFHKGGTNSGLFVQITQVDGQDLDIPGKAYTFGVLKSAQAAGDMAALVQRERRVIRLRIGSDVCLGLSTLLELFGAALA